MRQELSFEIPYTIGFCMLGDEVLMLHRKFPPNQNLWNGIGGKIDADETPDEAMMREMTDETGLDVNQVQSLNHVGVVRWNGVSDPDNSYKGMYAYIIRFQDGIDWKSKKTDEGLLAWKKLGWVLDKRNRQVVSNIAHFLPVMLETSVPVIYDCHYVDGSFEKLSIYPLD